MYTYTLHKGHLKTTFNQLLTGAGLSLMNLFYDLQVIHKLISLRLLQFGSIDEVTGIKHII